MKNEKTVLMVMDFQNDIVHEEGKFAGWGIPAHVKQQQAIENTAQLIEKARKAGVKIIYFTVSYAEDYPELEHSKMPIYAGMKEAGALIKGQWGAQIHDALAPQEGEPVLNKTRVNPFTNPRLEEELQGKENILVTGVLTNFVVEEFTRTAAAKDFNVVVLEDCCASMGQEMHEFPIKNILPNLAVVKNNSTFSFE